MELASILVRRAVSSTTSDRTGCGACGRVPLPGEVLHHLEEGGALCALCRSSASDGQRRSARAERVPADDRPMRVGPLAAPRRAA